MIEREYAIEGMHCGACVGLVTDEVGEVEGVERVDVDLDGKRARVLFDPGKVDDARIMDAVREAGYTATPIG